MTTIEALLKIDTLQLISYKQQCESQNLKLELEKNHYKKNMNTYLMLVDKGLMLDVTTVGHHHILL